MADSNGRRRRLPVLAFALLLTAPPAVAITNPSLVVEEVALNVPIRGGGHALDAVIVKRAGVDGRLPVAIITHGSPRDPADRPPYRADRLLPQALDLAHRGWLAVGFLRRGFGRQPNRFSEGFRCDGPDYRYALRTAAEDIEAVRAAVVKRTDADATRVIGLGVSVGGAAMLAWSATRPEGLVAVVNVSGGIGSLKPQHNCDERALVSVIGSFGARSRVPTLWLYSENDSYFGPDLVRRMHVAFTKSGGAAMLDLFGPIGRDGHEIWSTFDGRKIWLPALDRFLRAHALPTWELRALESIASRLGPVAQRVLPAYLDAPAEKAFAVSSGKGVVRYYAGVVSLQVARDRSRELCEQASGERCQVFIENFTPAALRPQGRP